MIADTCYRSCAPGTTRARNTSSWMESYALTWYPTNAHFQPRVRAPLLAYASNHSSIHHRVRRPLPRQRPLWAPKGTQSTVRQASAMAAVSTNLLGRARGRSSDLSGFRRNGPRSFGDLRPRGRSKEPLVALPGLPLPIVRVRRVPNGGRSLREHGEVLRGLHRRDLGQERRFLL